MKINNKLKIAMGLTATTLAATSIAPQINLKAYQMHFYTIHMEGSTVGKLNPYYANQKINYTQTSRRSSVPHTTVTTKHHHAKMISTSHIVKSVVAPKPPVRRVVAPKPPVRRVVAPQPPVRRVVAPQPPVRRVVTTQNNSIKNLYRSWLNSPDMVLINKTHGVSSSYVPSNLQHIRNGFYLKSVAVNAFKEMESAYRRQYGINFEIVSTYRSYWTQQSTHQHWVNVYGSSYANKVSAIAGQSEHQSGLALDIQNIGHSVLDESFENTQTFRWLQDNAYKYGFILRFPKGKTNITGYNYEPWHYRYIGKDQAKLFHSKGAGYTYEQFVDFLKAASR